MRNKTFLWVSNLGGAPKIAILTFFLLVNYFYNDQVRISTCFKMLNVYLNEYEMSSYGTIQLIYLP